MIKAVIGESCGRSRLSAAESSICVLRAFAATASNGGGAKRYKNEDTWCGKLTYFRYGIRYSPEIGKPSRGSGTDDFPLISDGDPNLLAANRDNDGHWLNANYDRPDDNWNSDNGFAFAQQITSFLSHFLREFSFASFPYQPPRFLPTSSSFADNAIYFLLSKDFVSQSIIKNTLKTSSRLIAKRTNGSFSF